MSRISNCPVTAVQVVLRSVRIDRYFQVISQLIAIKMQTAVVCEINGNRIAAIAANSYAFTLGICLAAAEQIVFTINFKTS